jgi:hypothetical protein
MKKAFITLFASVLLIPAVALASRTCVKTSSDMGTVKLLEFFTLTQVSAEVLRMEEISVILEKVPNSPFNVASYVSWTKDNAYFHLSFLMSSPQQVSLTKVIFNGGVGGAEYLCH